MDAKQRLFFNLARMQRFYFEVVREKIGDQPIHPKQGPILGALMHHDGLSQADLVRMLGVRAATVAVSIGRLEKLGFVKREHDEHNRRAYVLALTEAGRSEAEMVQNAMEEVRDGALMDFTDQELECISSYCERMLQNMAALYQPGKEGDLHPCTKC
ncbi:MAG: MarR family transcriptional regulator [Clostridia bacterium]